MPPTRPRFRPRAACPLAGIAIVAVLAGAPSPAPAADGPWGYTIGESRPAQQVNLCSSTGEARELANIFRKYGVRAGFSALSNAPACARAIVAVTPLAVVEQVRIAPDAADEYHVSFIAVRVDDDPGEAPDAGPGDEPDDGGSDAILVTTRSVTAP